MDTPLNDTIEDIRSLAYGIINDEFEYGTHEERARKIVDHTSSIQEMRSASTPLKPDGKIDLDSGITAVRAKEDEPDGLTLKKHGATHNVIGADRDDIRLLAELVGYTVVDE